MIGFAVRHHVGRNPTARLCVLALTSLALASLALSACSLVMPEPLPFPVDMGEPDMKVPMKPDLYLPTGGSLERQDSPLTLSTAGAEAGAEAGAVAGAEAGAEARAVAGAAAGAAAETED